PKSGPPISLQLMPLSNEPYIEPACPPTPPNTAPPAAARNLTFTPPVPVSILTQVSPSFEEEYICLDSDAKIEDPDTVKPLIPALVGIPELALLQVTPSSVDRKTPLSVPAKKAEP